MIKVRVVLPVGIVLILLSGISSSFAQEYKRDIAEYKEKRSINSEGYQYGKALGKEKTSALQYLFLGGGIGAVHFATLGMAPALGLVSFPVSFVATPYLLKGSKMPEDAFQKAQARGPEYLGSFQAGWKKETRSKKRTYYRWGHGVVPVALTVWLTYLIASTGVGST